MHTVELELRELRVVGGLALAAAAVQPLVGLGLPCPLRSMTGVPCPLCGMTTSVVAAVRGDVGAAMAANPGGVLLVVCAVLLLVGARFWMRRGWRVSVPGWLPPAALVLLWLFQLNRFEVI